MHPTDELIPVLKKLRLSGVMQSLDMRMRQAVDDDLAHSEFLLRLLTDEVERRGAKQLDSRLRRANFEHHKSLEDFDFTFNPKIPKAKVIDLATCTFVAKHENVCLVGQTGVGKSHIAQALGHRACVAGYQVLYTSAHQMLTGLRAGRADNSHERRLARYASVDLLIIDDLGLRGLTGEEPIDLYDIIRERCEFRRHLGSDSGDTWAPVPETPGHQFRPTWAPIPEHLGSGSGGPGHQFRRTWAPRRAEPARRA